MENLEEYDNVFRPLIQSCCNPAYNIRPTAEQVKSEIAKLSSLLLGGYHHQTLAERILVRLSKYSEDLENEVQKRSSSLLDERVHCDTVLAQFLPR